MAVDGEVMPVTAMDNVTLERLWCSGLHGEVHLAKAIVTLKSAREVSRLSVAMPEIGNV